MQIKGIIKDACILFIITIVSGLLLGLTYQVTKEPIKKEELRAKQEAYEKVFKDAAFEENKELSGKAKDAKTVLAKEGLDYVEINEIMEAKDSNGDVAGYVMSVTTPKGYGGNIKISLGIKADGTVSGIEFLEINETAGLGMKAKEDAFKSQFQGIKDKVEYTKTGEKGDNIVDALSGATVTTKAVTGAVNAGLCFVNSISNNN